MRTLKGALVAATLGVLLLVTASSAAAATGGKIYIYVLGVNSAHQPILIAGAIGDHGIATSETKSGKVDQNGSYVHIALTKGTFLVDATKLNGSQNGKAVVQNKTSCSFVFKVTGPIKISDGTGAYKGISGTANMTITFGGVGPYYTSGAKKGQCNTSQNATPSGVYQSITGSGVRSSSANSAAFRRPSRFEKGVSGGGQPPRPSGSPPYNTQPLR